MEKITLCAQDGTQEQLQLHKEQRPYRVEEILNVHNKVYNDVIYSIKLEPSKSIDNIYVYVNQDMTVCDFRDNTIYFYEDSRYVFNQIIGLAQITMFIMYSDGSTEWMYSEYVSVLIKSTETNRALDSMLKYVYENQADVLRYDRNVTGTGATSYNVYDDFWSQIVLLEEIANTYENNYGYFMANCRTKLEKVDTLERIEKLQEITPKTIQYIVQHPEYLKSSVSGIKSGRQCFLPSKTLMTQNRITNDIYENRVVVGFLELLLSEIRQLSKKITDYTSLIGSGNETENGYIVSSHLLYMNAHARLIEFLEKLSVLENKYHQLLVSYSNILKVKRIPMQSCPEPSAIFMNVPQYNKIYTEIRRWFGKKGYDLQNERVMLQFMNAPAIYEAYVLIKLINHIKDRGYKLVTSEVVTYPKQSSWIYKNGDYQNTFVFEGEDAKITLYYEPVLYDTDCSDVNQISLYRNNTISLNHETDDERKGHYYVPDFIIKYEERGVERYLICDAKFSRKNKVQYQLLPDLIYRYLVSVSPISTNVTVAGMIIFYGLTEENEEIESFYNRKLKEGPNILPRIEMLPLSENLAYSIQDSNSIEMFRMLLTE